MGLRVALLNRPRTIKSMGSVPALQFDADFGSALDAARAIRDRRISAVELMEHTFRRVRRFNPGLNAIILDFEDEAMSSARAADAAVAHREQTGPFHGVPMTLKECLAWHGTPTTAGFVPWKDECPQPDAICAARLAGAGAIVIGKTNVPVLLSDWQTYNPIYGTTNNPWNTAYGPGGSSGGSSAALAAGLGFLSVGSDIGGSLRVPAHFCGIASHKPSLNLIPAEGHVPPPPGARNIPPADLEVVGPMGRHPRDLTQALRVMAGIHGFDAKAYRLELPEARHRCLSEFRVGAVADTALCPVAAEQKEVFESFFSRLEPHIARFQEGLPAGLKFSFSTYLMILGGTISAALPEEAAEAMRTAPSMGPFDRFRQGHYARHRYFLEANSLRLNIRAIWEEYFRDFDVFLMPVAITPAFTHQQDKPLEERTLNINGVSRPYMDMIMYPHFASVAGLPATVVTIGHTNAGLPVGVQILGPYLEDLTALEFASLVEEVTGGFVPPAGYRLT